MFSEPDSPVGARMRAARAMACGALGVVDLAGDVVWGYGGRTLSGAVSGGGWLRVVEGGVGGKLREGSRTAQELVPAAVPRPVLRRIHDWDDYRAELYEYVPTGVVSRSPVLEGELTLDEKWWAELGAALGMLATVPTDRVSVREEYVRRAVPEFTGCPVGEITWSTAHGDFHWANLTGPRLMILDWEGWGRAPYGFDAALLHVYALRAPATAARVRTVLAPILDRPEARVAELVVCAQVLQAERRTAFYTDLAGAVREYLGSTAAPGSNGASPPLP